MAKFKKGDRVVVRDMIGWYYGNGTIVGTEVGGYLVDTDGPNKAPRPDGKLWCNESELTPLEEKSKFKVGDIITATEDNPYVITNKDMTKGEVVDVYFEGTIRVKVLEHRTNSFEVGEVYDVNPKYFELVDIAEFKVGDKVASLMDGEVFTLKERKPELDGTNGAAWTVEEYSFGWIGEDEVKLVEIVEEEADFAKLKAGDKVRGIRTGLIYTLKKRKPEFDTTLAGKAWSIDNSGGWVGAKQVELVEEPVEEKPKLKVGDIVTGTETSSKHYGITTADMTKGEVVEVNDGDIRVKVLEHKTMSDNVGETYYVDADYFVKVDPASKKYDDELRPQVGDKVKVVSAFGTEGQYGNGDVLTITQIDHEDDGRFFVEENDRPIRDSEVELLERKAEESLEEALVKAMLEAVQSVLKEKGLAK